jgi:eukaryotic-like serine/threonine-protein kinase
VRLGVHLAAAAESADGRMSRTPPFVDRDRMPDVRAALVAGGFVLLVGDSTAGKSRLAFEAMRALPAGARLRHA